MAKLLGIDIGTSGCKVLLIDEFGRVLKQASAEYPISVPKPMWSEQNPEDWWSGVQQCLQEIGEPSPDAIGVTGQMHGACFLDSKGAVIRPAILWNDQRTVAECEEIDRVVGVNVVRQTTCNPPLTGFQAPKLLWLRNHEPENYAKLRTLLLPKDYIRYKLSGAFATEVSDAAGTGLLDVPNRKWSSAVVSALKIDESILPEVFESDQVTCKTNGTGGLTAGIPIVGGGGDQAAAAVGTGAVAPGIISVSLGTSGVVFTSIPDASFDPSGAAHTFCHANRGWHAMGVMLSCGGALRWFRDTFGVGNYVQIGEEAASAPLGSEGITFLPYLTGERSPHNDPFARASFSGITLGNTRAHFCRSVFEGMSFGLQDCMQLLKSLGATATDVRVTSGGAKSRFWVQMLANVFNAKCTTLETDEGPAFGAAILAGVGIGVWNTVQEACPKVVRATSETNPNGEDYSEAYRKYRALYLATRGWNKS